MSQQAAPSLQIGADRGYDANHLSDWLSEAEAVACIPPRKNRNVQFEYDIDL